MGNKRREITEATTPERGTLTINSDPVRTIELFEPGDTVVVVHTDLTNDEINDQTEYDIMIIDIPSGHPIIDPRVYVR